MPTRVFRSPPENAPLVRHLFKVRQSPSNWIQLRWFIVFMDRHQASGGSRRVTPGLVGSPRSQVYATQHRGQDGSLVLRARPLPLLTSALHEGTNEQNTTGPSSAPEAMMRGTARMMKT